VFFFVREKLPLKRTNDDQKIAIFF
jgi:hypothetical protein